MTSSREIQISDYLPSGTPNASHFKLVTKELPRLENDQLLVKNLYMTVDPYMRGRMINQKTYIDPFQLNTALEGGAVGQVTESNHPDYKEGDYVLSMNGWREYFISDGKGIDKIPATKETASHFLGALGMPGLTAFGSLERIGKLKAGETVFVSAASGAVGALVCQIAKLKGCKVLASVGSQAKVDYVKNELGVDAAFNYKECASIHEMVKELAPQGIDVYFENVGGEHLEAALEHMNLHGRLIMCGMISQYNSEAPAPGPRNLMQVVAKRLTMQGFIVFDFQDLQDKFVAEMSEWLSQGKVKAKETVLDGIDNAPEAFLSLFTGGNLGKMLVKL